MATAKSNTARRREVRRSIPKPQRGWQHVLRRREVGWAVAYLLIIGLVGGLIIISAQRNPRYKHSQVTEEPIVSRVAFQAIDRIATMEKQIRAQNAILPVYVPNPDYTRWLREKFSGLIGLADYNSIEQVQAEYRDQVQLNQLALRQLKDILAGEGGARAWEDKTEQFIQSLFDRAILMAPDYDRDKRDGDQPRIVVRHPLPRVGEQAERQPPGQWVFRLSNQEIDQAAIRQEVSNLAMDHFPGRLELGDTIEAMVMWKPQATYIYDRALTEQRRAKAAQDAAAEPEYRQYDAGEVIVPAGVELEQRDLELIKAERAAFAAWLRADRPSYLWLEWTGVIGLVLLLAFGVLAYCFFFNYRVIRNPMRGAALTGLMLSMQLLAVTFAELWPSYIAGAAAAPTLAAAMILAIAYDQRFALGIGFFHAVLVMLSLDANAGFGVGLLAGVGVAVAMLKDVRTRSKLVRVGLWSGVAMGLTVLAMSLARRPLYLDGQLLRIGRDSMAALVAGLSTGVVVQAVLPLIERVFKVTTAMTLKELNDASHPLLQRLAQEAPGTYQHSLRIADMAEAAADSIGADGLLCRVGAMYHDIGKINKPMYFIENQGGGPNRHSKLSPAMSLLIIVGHVKDGIEMAREFALPTVIRHFIESHHGTTLVEYFYHAAKKQKEAEDKPGPSEFEFRYPGPKPQTKEAGIMLLCDSLEAAARALPEPTPVRLEQLVHSIANKRLMDGQFDECSLTLQELSRIEQAITKTLCAVYHARIKYPSAKEEPPAGDQRQVARTGT